MENCYKRMPNDVEMPAVSDDLQALHQEERTIADIYKARRERRERILRESVPLFIRNKERIFADEKTARCHIDGIRFGLAYSGEWKMPVVFLSGLLRLWERPTFQAECPKCHETAYCTGGGGGLRARTHATQGIGPHPFQNDATPHQAGLHPEYRTGVQQHHARAIPPVGARRPQNPAPAND